MINNQIPRPDQGVAALPWTTPGTMKAMLKIATAIGGPVDLAPCRRFAGTVNTILLEAGRLLIAGTRTASGIGLVDYVNADRIFLRSAGAKIPSADLVISH